jgi:hypothetical protein
MLCYVMLYQCGFICASCVIDSFQLRQGGVGVFHADSPKQQVRCFVVCAASECFHLCMGLKVAPGLLTVLPRPLTAGNLCFALYTCV